MENLPITVYASPRTGYEYLIFPKTSKRGAWDNDGNYYQKEHIQYDIVLNGHPVQFSLTEEGIPSQVEYFENPGPDVGSRFD
jgi:hypothetical protein